jgi:acetylornithine deacetylase
VPIKADDIRQAVDAGLDVTVEFLEEMIRHPSIAGSEGEVQRLIAERFQELGVTVDAMPVPERLKDDPEYSGRDTAKPYTGRANLVVRRAGKGGGRSLLLNSHSDLVSADDWPGAFTPKIANGVVHGRGSADAKGCVATMYLVNRALGRLGVRTKGDLVTTVVIEEEIGGNGSLALIRQGVRADAAVVLEITDLRLCIANRGAVWFQLEVDGRPTHMGSITDGVSAVEKAWEAIELWRSYEQRLIEDAKTQALFAEYERPAQLNVGMIRGGEWPSMVPAHCRVEGGVGFLPNTSLDQVKAEMVRLIEERGDAWLRSHYRLGFNRLHNDAYHTPADDPFVRAMSASVRAAELDGTPRGWISSCDARLWAKVGGMPTVVFGPGSLKLAHSDRECVKIADVARAAAALVRTVIDWCGT